jgi:hypothetical protein
MYCTSPECRLTCYQYCGEEHCVIWMSKTNGDDTSESEGKTFGQANQCVLTRMCPRVRIPLGLAHPRVTLAFNSLLKEYAGAQIGGKSE